MGLVRAQSRGATCIPQLPASQTDARKRFTRNAPITVLHRGNDLAMFRDDGHADVLDVSAKPGRNVRIVASSSSRRPPSRMPRDDGHQSRIAGVDFCGNVPLAPRFYDVKRDLRRQRNGRSVRPGTAWAMATLCVRH